MTIIPFGFYPIAEGRIDMLWRECSTYIDEIKQFQDSNSRYKFRASRFRKKDDEIIKEKICETMQEATVFLDG